MYSEACLSHSLPSVQNALGGECRNQDRMKIDPIYNKNQHMTYNMGDQCIYHEHCGLYQDDENSNNPGKVRGA